VITTLTARLQTYYGRTWIVQSVRVLPAVQNWEVFIGAMAGQKVQVHPNVHAEKPWQMHQPVSYIRSFPQLDNLKVLAQ